jgi:hypothetical protein
LNFNRGSKIIKGGEKLGCLREIVTFLLFFLQASRLAAYADSELILEI